MSNESLKAKLDAYNAEYAKQVAKHPERVGLKHKNLYTPLDLDGFDYEKTSVSRANIHIPVAYSPPCTVAVSGPCVCMLVSPPLKNPTNVINT